MTASKNNFLDHVKWLRSAAKDQGAELLIAADSMQALMRRGTYYAVLFPRFVASANGRSQYVSQWTDEVTHFGGWLPYGVRRWPISTDKLLFKRYAQSVGLRVPEYAVSADAGLQDVVVKRAASSFGEQVRGPFRQSSQCALDVSQGDYYERFVDGEHLKVWYWNGAPVGMEIDQPPCIAGDGVWTFGERIAQRIGAYPGQKAEWVAAVQARCEVFLRYHGLSLETTLARGKRHPIEFRYGSTLMLAADRQVVRLEPGGDPAFDELHRAGTVLMQAIPEGERMQVLFAVDAIRDREGRIWFLEINSNPAVHPLAYPAMVESVLRQGDAAGATPSPEPALPTQRIPALA